MGRGGARMAGSGKEDLWVKGKVGTAVGQPNKRPSPSSRSSAGSIHASADGSEVDPRQQQLFFFFVFKKKEKKRKTQMSLDK